MKFVAKDGQTDVGSFAWMTPKITYYLQNFTHIRTVFKFRCLLFKYMLPVVGKLYYASVGDVGPPN